MITFIAFPYTHDSPEITRWRMNMFWKYSGRMLSEGDFVISPMSMLSAAENTHKGLDFDNWSSYCEALILKSDKLCVLRLPGWENSQGVLAEIKIAETNGIPVTFMDLDETEREPSIEYCEECKTGIILSSNGGGVRCNNPNCGYWFCY